MLLVCNCKRTVRCGALHGDVQGMFLESNNGCSFPFDEFGCSVEIHGGILHGVYHLPVEGFWAFSCRKFGDVGDVAEPADAEDQKIHLVHLCKFDEFFFHKYSL